MTRDDVWVGRGFMLGDKLLRVTRVMARWFELEDGSRWCVGDWRTYPRKGWMAPCLESCESRLVRKVSRNMVDGLLRKMSEDELVQLNEVLDRARARLEGGGK